MWKIIYDTDYSNEPVEVRNLKAQLANNSCKCARCVINNNSSLEKENRFDKETQVKRSNTFQGAFRVLDHKIHDTQSLCNGVYFRKDIFCPGCYMALNRLYFQDAKVLKDEESETKTEMFSCDKSTEKTVKLTEKTTSTMNKPTPNYSHLSLCDVMSELSTDTSISSSQKRNSERAACRRSPRLDQEMPLLLSRNCLCMENFINSIRPPLNDTIYEQ